MQIRATHLYYGIWSYLCFYFEAKTNGSPTGHTAATLPLSAILNSQLSALGSNIHQFPTNPCWHSFDTLLHLVKKALKWVIHTVKIFHHLIFGVMESGNNSLEIYLKKQHPRKTFFFAFFISESQLLHTWRNYILLNEYQIPSRTSGMFCTYRFCWNNWISKLVFHKRQYIKYTEVS